MQGSEYAEELVYEEDNGLGERGLEGKISAVRYARENGVPFFGICLGMQMCVVEFARNVLGLNGAHSTEVNPGTEYPVINLMEDQKSTTSKGGTMRLGAYKCELRPGFLAEKIYGKSIISERHRHRYEFNSDYLNAFEQAGMFSTGRNPDTKLVEIVEIPEHPFFIGAFWRRHREDRRNEQENQRGLWIQQVFQRLRTDLPPEAGQPDPERPVLHRPELLPDGQRYPPAAA